VPRQLREEVEGGIFHVFARGNDKRVIFIDDVDRRMYLRLLRGSVRHCRWRLLAYCLMHNHIHLLVETPKPNLGAGMARMHSSYAQRFNARHGKCGHLFQGRYGAVRIETDEHLWTAAVYVARNPVEGGLCRNPEEWPWSSHQATVSGTAPDWVDDARLLAYFAAAGGDGKRRYAAACRAPAADQT
jgi:putative transposase